MDNNRFWLILVLVIINLFSFVFVGVDKRKSYNPNANRLPEVYFFFLSSLFGSLGIFLGMLAFRHKIRKFYFPLGVGLILAQQALLVSYFIR